MGRQLPPTFVWQEFVQAHLLRSTVLLLHTVTHLRQAQAHSTCWSLSAHTFVSGHTAAGSGHLGLGPSPRGSPLGYLTGKESPFWSLAACHSSAAGGQDRDGLVGGALSKLCWQSALKASQP